MAVTVRPAPVRRPRRAGRAAPGERPGARGAGPVGVPGPRPRRRTHYVAELAADHDGRALLVAVVEQGVVGLAEVSIDPPPPVHRILLPVPSGHLHLVVAAHERGQGLGRRLERAAREWASLRGVRQLVAGIHVDNRTALEFYDRRGYRGNAMIRLADLDEASG